MDSCVPLTCEHDTNRERKRNFFGHSARSYFPLLIGGVTGTDKSRTWKEETDAVNSMSSVGYMPCCCSAPVETSRNSCAFN